MVFKRQVIHLFKVFVLSFCFANSFAQRGAEADSLLLRASDLLYSKPELAEKITKMVYEHNNSSDTKIKALFLLSRIEYIYGNYQSSLTDLYAVENLISNSGNKDLWSIKLNYFLSDIYRDLQILDLAEKHFDLANYQFESINNQSFKNIFDEIYNYENAVHESKNGNYGQSNLLLKRNLNSDGNILFLSLLGLGENYISTNQSDSADIYFSQIPAELEILYARSLLGRAKSALLKNDWNSAEVYLRNSLNPNYESVVLKEVFNIYSQKYLNSADIDRHEFYKVKYDSIDKKINFNLDQAKNFVIKHIEEDNLKAESEENSFWTKSLFIVICLIILLAIPVIYYYFKTQSDYRKYLQVVDDINKKQKESVGLNQPKEKQILIPEKSEQLLIKKLEKFESSQNYLNSKVSLTTLSKQLDTNTKYLSEVINKNKGKNFNSYINELRIDYILKKLKTEPKYRNYKVVSLAEECGYVSHSTFIAAFRSVTGISPASFITFLKRKKNNETDLS